MKPLSNHSGSSPSAARLSSPKSGQAGSGTGSAGARFLSTAWTVISHAQSADREISHRYLGLLISKYWRPVYSFLRQSGKSHEDAKDLTQGFFATFVEKDAVRYADKDRGKFRSFLVASVKRYLAQEHRARPGKRVGMPFAEFETATREPAFGECQDDDPERAFMRNWAKCVVENSLSRLQQECILLGKERQSDVFRARYLQDPSSPPTYAEIAASLGISEKDVANCLQRAKSRLRRILREEIRNSMLAQSDVDEEIGELLRALAS